MSNNAQASVFAFNLGIAVINLLLTQQQLGHASPAGTARDYLHPRREWDDHLIVAYEIASGHTFMTPSILEKHGFTTGALELDNTKGNR